MIIIDRRVTDAVNTFVADERGDALFTKDGTLGDVGGGAGGVSVLEGNDRAARSARIDVQDFLNGITSCPEETIRGAVTNYVDTHFANRAHEGATDANAARGPLIDALVGVALDQQSKKK